MKRPTKAADLASFKKFCQQATDNQLRNIYFDELRANRCAFADVARTVKAQRGLT